MPRVLEERRARSLGSEDEVNSSTSASSSTEEDAFGFAREEDLFEVETNHIEFAAKDPPPVFTELLELTTYADGFQEWKERAR